MITPGQKYAVRIMFGIPWIVFAIQHYMYADFVSTLVPAYMPWRLFWAYFTGTAMLAAGVSFIIGRQVQLAAFLLGCLMILYLLMVHPLLILPGPQVGQHWMRFFQDIAIMAACFALASSRRKVIVRYCYALPFIILGAQHFTHNASVTAKVPDWAPLQYFWDYIIGLTLIGAVYGMLFTSRKRWTASTLGIILTVLALLRHVPLMIKDPHNPVEWTGAFLDIALAAGAFIIAETVDR